MRASALAVRAYRQMGYDGIIGAVHDGGVVELDPATEHPDDVFRYADFFANRMILAPALQGQLPPEMDEILEKLGVSLYRSPNDVEEFRDGKVDFIGLNVYCREYVTDWHGGELAVSANNKGGSSKKSKENALRPCLKAPATAMFPAINGAAKYSQVACIQPSWMSTSAMTRPASLLRKTDMAPMSNQTQTE